MNDYDLDKEDAEEVIELSEELGIDYDDAIEVLGEYVKFW